MSLHSFKKFPSKNKKFNIRLSEMTSKNKILDEKPSQTDPTHNFRVGWEKMLDEKFDLDQISSNTIQHDFFLLFKKCWMKLVLSNGPTFSSNTMLDENVGPFAPALRRQWIELISTLEFRNVMTSITSTTST